MPPPAKPEHVALLARAAEAWPELGPPGPSFLARLAEADETPAHPGDLYLAHACAEGQARALEAFERAHLGPQLGAALVRFRAGPDLLDEVRATLRTRLFCPPSGEPRIRAYAGRAPLASWVKVAAVRTAVDLLRARGEVREQTGEAALGQATALVDPELGYLKGRYREAFQEALSEAVHELSDEQCNLLRLKAVDGLRSAEIAALLKVDRSTVKRRLAEAREAVYEGTRRRLEQRLALSAAEFRSLLDLVRSQLHLSLGAALRPSG